MRSFSLIKILRIQSTEIKPLVVSSFAAGLCVYALEALCFHITLVSGSGLGKA